MNARAEQPLISVVMATYNGERYLDAQLQSILDQTHRNLEIIIVDDMSTDGTRALIEAYANRDSRIRYAWNESNAGTNATFGKALSLATGEFVAISDQDDVWDERKLDLLLAHIGQRDCIYTDSILIDREGKPLQRNLLASLNVRKPVTGNDTWSLMARNCIAGHSLLIRKEIVDSALPLYRAEGLFYDHQLAIIATLNNGIHYHTPPLTYHRIHGNNQVHQLLKAGSKERSTQQARREDRYQRQAGQLATTIKFVNHHVNSHPDRYHRRPETMKTVDFLNRILARLERRPAGKFDLQLFFLLFVVRKQLFSFAKKNPLAICLRLARAAPST